MRVNGPTGRQKIVDTADVRMGKARRRGARVCCNALQEGAVQTRRAVKEAHAVDTVLVCIAFAAP